MAAKTKHAQRTPAERMVWNAFLDAGYQANGICANPYCGNRSVCVTTAGVNPLARVCIICFEFEFDCKHPTKKKIDSLCEKAGRR